MPKLTEEKKKITAEKLFEDAFEYVVEKRKKDLFEFELDKEAFYNKLIENEVYDTFLEVAKVFCAKVNASLLLGDEE